MGVGLQVLAETVCSLIFNLWHLWRGCQTIECSIPALQTPSSWRKVGNFGFIPFFQPCQSLFNIRFAVGLFGFGPASASGAGQSISPATPGLCLWSLQNPRMPPWFCWSIPPHVSPKWWEALGNVTGEQWMSGGDAGDFPGTKGCCILCDNSPFFSSLLALWLCDLFAGWQASTALQEMDVCSGGWGGGGGHINV